MYWGWPFLVYDLPFSHSLNIGIMRSYLGQTPIIFFLYELPLQPNFWFFFFTEMHRTKTQTKGYSRFFSFQVPFELSALDNLYAKHALKSRQFIAIKMNKSLLEKRENTLLCGSLLETCVQSLNLVVWATLALELVKFSPLASQWNPLTKKTVTSNTL